MTKVHVFIVFKLMTPSEFLYSIYSTELSKTKINFKKLGWSVEGGPWKGSNGWSMDLGSVFSTVPLSQVKFLQNLLDICCFYYK